MPEPDDIPQDELTDSFKAALPALTDQEDRAINHETAAEWLRLPDEIIAQSTPIK